MNETKWLTVKEASLHCLKMGLPRSTKSLRRWCAKDEVEAQKRKAANTEKWFIDRESLEIKIKEELEFLQHSEKSFPYPETPSGQDTAMSAHERTGADISGHERLQAVTGAYGVDISGGADVRDLEDQILLLNNDIKWRDRVLKEQKNANEVLMDEVKGQSRYIGHLETNVLRLGGKTDQTFLAAPVPNSGLSRDAESQSEMFTPDIIGQGQLHPDQPNDYTG